MLLEEKQLEVDRLYDIAEPINSTAQLLYGDEFLEGYCGICSIVLLIKLVENDINAVLCHGTYDGYNHCWVETDKYLIDLTTRQFNNNNFDIEIHLLRDICIADYKIINR